MTETQYQTKLIKKLTKMFPGCEIFKTGADQRQGVPDLILLWYDCWASLEVKKSLNANRQPNQEFYVERLNEMSFAAFICPENEEEVLNALQQAFEITRRTRVP